MSHTAAQIGDPQVRHRGTIGGSLAHGDPASDLPTVILALGAELVARGCRRRAGDPGGGVLHRRLRDRAGAGEVLVEVRVPKLTASSGSAYVKANRRAQDWATVAVAAVVHRSNGGIDAASVTLTNMGGTPLRARGVEEALAGGASVADAAARAADGT